MCCQVRGACTARNHCAYVAESLGEDGSMLRENNVAEESEERL